MSIQTFRRPLFRQPTITIKNDKVYLRCDFIDKDKAKEIPGYRWDREQKCWMYPLSVEVIRQIMARFAVDMDLATAAVVEKMMANEQEALKIKLGNDSGPIEPMPIKNAIPFKHQIRAYNFACRLMGVFNE